MSGWACGICLEVLVHDGGSWVCANGHSFDVARGGYVNFLVGRQKAGHKGDTEAMFGARCRFLEAGYYGPLRDYLVRIVVGLNKNVVVEAGCGEGYYIGGISEHINSSKCWAFDISKDGIRMASNRYKRVSFAVADTNLRLPFGDGSVGVVLDVFAPRNGAEFARILKKDGRLVVVIPTAQHLAELRGVAPLLAIQDDKRTMVEKNLSEWFDLVRAERLVVPLVLDGRALMDLVGMTPNAWFLKSEQKEQFAAVERMDVTAEFEVLVFGQRVS